MSKTPVKIALDRQIPEYIRGEYELFVNFIKAYYEFLDQTQQRNLEDIRSIENTLEEFVIRFKKELSVLFPTNTLANERFILQKIREFYQTRGSKESFQFLFRILFNKDSDIFYPSTQILRASDGKWIQEKSVFVRSQAGNLFNLSGKMIKIQTGNKQIFVYCPRVVLYREDIYEVFINRSYIQDIDVGDTVKSENDDDYGEIIRCPNKYTIVSKGAGFEVGQLLYLKTESGDGSLIKITKTGTNGSIERIQIISFGLDYESTFYAKLSNKQSTALLYYSPLQNISTVFYPDAVTAQSSASTGDSVSLFFNDSQQAEFTNTTTPSAAVSSTYSGQSTFNISYKVGNVSVYKNDVLLSSNDYTATNGTTIVLSVPAVLGDVIKVVTLNTNTPYQDATNGFVDYGYINTQDYFYFDVNLPADQRVAGKTETVFYADGTYVGEIIGSFYTNDANTNVIDEDTAEIKVELGPVAVYPGYYQTSDGFISDESYIQDGKYYQLFSYVIKVEQQIDTYLEIVKQLLHPAGMELFAEFNIKNEYLVSASPLLAFIRRQFLEQQFITDDEGSNETHLFIRRYLSNGTLSTETDPRRWSTANAISIFANNTLNSSDKNDISLSIRKYDSLGNLTGETDELRWSTIDPAAPFAHDVFNNGLGDAYILTRGSYDPITGIAITPFVDSPVEPMGDFSKSQDFKIPTLSIRKYDSNGNLTGESDQRRWSTVDTLHDFPHDVNTGGQDNFYQVNLSIRKYDNTGNDTGETDQRRWSLATPSTTVANLSGAVRSFEISSIEGGTFYKTVSGISAFDSNRLAGTLPQGRPESERDRIVTDLYIRKYDSSGNLTGETDQMRWSTVDTLHDFPHDVNTGGQDNFYQVNLSIRKYDSVGNLTGETDQRRWSTTNPDAPFAHDTLNSLDFYLLNIGSAAAPNANFIKTATALSAFDSNRLAGTSTDRILTTLSIRKYDSSGNLTGETDQRRWSTVDAIHDFPHDVNTGGQDNFYQVNLSIRKYDSAGNDTSETDQRRWSLAPAIDSFDRISTYDRSIIPLVSLDPAIALSAFDSNRLSGISPNKDNILTSLFIRKYYSDGTETGETDQRRWSTSTATEGAIPGVANTRFLVSPEYYRAPELVLTGTVTAGSNVMTMSGTSTTNGIQPGRILTKISGTGAFGAGEIRVFSVTSNLTSFVMNTNASVSGSIVFSVSFDTPELAQFVDTPIEGPRTFAFSSLNSDGSPRTGGTWSDYPIPADSFDRVSTYDRSVVPLVSLDPALANEGPRTFAFSSLNSDGSPRTGGTWTDLLSSPTDNRSGSEMRPSYQDTINNSNTGTLYYNAFNQNTSDPLSSFSYFAETYAEVTTRALS